MSLVMASLTPLLYRIPYPTTQAARGHVEDGKVAHYQVTLKVGFTLDHDD
jgi:flavin-binding protein dodecin